MIFRFSKNFYYIFLYFFELFRIFLYCFFLLSEKIGRHDYKKIQKYMPTVLPKILIFKLSNVTDWTKNPGLHPDCIIHGTSFQCKFTSLTYKPQLQLLTVLIMCPFPPNPRKRSTLTFKTPGHLVLHMDAYLLECKSENHWIWPEWSSLKDVLFEN